MKRYKYVDVNTIVPVPIRLRRNNIKTYVYANEEEQKDLGKELIIEDKPNYDEKVQELYSWFEELEDKIIQRYKATEKEVIEDEQNKKNI